MALSQATSNYLRTALANTAAAKEIEAILETAQILDTGTPGAALTAQSTAITHTAPGTPDFAIQDLINTNAYGFVSKDEGNTVLAVIANLQTRLAEVEARLEALGLIAAN